MTSFVNQCFTAHYGVNLACMGHLCWTDVTSHITISVSFILDKVFLTVELFLKGTSHESCNICRGEKIIRHPVLEWLGQCGKAECEGKKYKMMKREKKLARGWYDFSVYDAGLTVGFIPELELKCLIRAVAFHLLPSHRKLLKGKDRNSWDITKLWRFGQIRWI